MSGFDELISEVQNDKEQYDAAVDFFLSLKEKTAEKKDDAKPILDSVSSKKPDVRTVSRVSLRRHLARQGVDTTPLKAQRGRVTTVKTKAPRISAKRLALIDKPAKRLPALKKPEKFDPDKQKLRLKTSLASVHKRNLEKRAMISALMRDLAAAGQGTGRSLKHWWGGNKEGLKGTLEGLTTQKETTKELLKRKFMNIFRRGPNKQLSALEQAAAKGPAYKDSFIRGQELNQQLGLSPLMGEFRAAVTGPGGTINPGSAYRGLESLGLLSGPALLGLGARAKAGLSEITAAKELAKRKKQLMLAGGAAAGMGGLALMKRDAPPPVVRMT